MARKVALDQPIHTLGIEVPVILDESDDHAGVLERGLALGYRGISSKACKGIYRSLHSAAHHARSPTPAAVGEDLTCQAGLAVQQDTLLAASLGVTHIERNGHHYVDGFGIAPDAEAHARARPCGLVRDRTRQAPPGGAIRPAGPVIPACAGFCQRSHAPVGQPATHPITFFPERTHMATQRLGIIMHGVTGRMGMNQHLIRSILAIRNQAA